MHRTSPNQMYEFVWQAAMEAEFYAGKFNWLAVCLHSYRSATSGSTLAARRAGIQQARSPVIISKAGTHVSVHASYGDTPQSCVAMTRPSARLAIIPSPTPIATK